MADLEKKQFRLTLANVTADRRFYLNREALDAFGESQGIFGHGRALDLQLTTIDNGGTTPTSDVTLEGSFDGGTTWVVAATWTQVTDTDTTELENVTTRYPPLLTLNIDVSATVDYTYTLYMTEYYE